jgi:hypothetical protein
MSSSSSRNAGAAVAADTLATFIDRLYDAIPSAYFEFQQPVPVLTVRPAFLGTSGSDSSDKDSVLLGAMLDVVYQSRLKERTAIVCSSLSAVEKVATYSPQFIAYSFDEDNSNSNKESGGSSSNNASSSSFYDAMKQRAAEEAGASTTHVVLLATVSSSSSSAAAAMPTASTTMKTNPTTTSTSASTNALHFTSPRLAANNAVGGGAALAAWRADFPNAKIVVRVVDTWEQLLWVLDQGVSGIISNDALNIRESVLSWYRDNCSFHSMLRHKAHKVIGTINGGSLD